MPDYTYKALAGTGAHNTGTLTANNEREAIAILDARGLYPLRIELARSATRIEGGGRRVGSRHLVTFFSQLADLLRAGVPLLRCLEVLERQTSQPALAGI